MTKRAFLPLAATLCTALAAQTPPAPKAQTPPDQKAYNAARSLIDPDQKLAALNQFLKDFPDSTRKSTAQGLIFTTLLKSFPQRTAEIDQSAKQQIKGNKGLSKWNVEARTALRLASAQPAGADLPLARKLADDALKNDTEPKLNKVYLSFFKGETPPKPADVHSFYNEQRTGALTASAYVCYRQGNTAQATAQIDEATALTPLDGDLNALRGNIAYDQHHNAEALEAFERAQVSGALSKHDRELFHTLYMEANPSGDLQTTLDAKYKELYPATFHPAPHQPAPGGHTVLLELYTGSGCPPCVGGDLAVEAFLESHPRTELVALAYDLHIPRADPLTSPDTVARAAWSKVNSTPSYVLDGLKLGAFGGDRGYAEEAYNKLLKTVDDQALKPSSVKIQLSAVPAAAGIINAQAVVTMGNVAALTQPTLPAPLPDSSAKKPASTPVTAAKPGVVSEPHYILNFALVEDDVRYSGENGVRFHRMVVRALAKPSEKGFPLEPGKSLTLDTSFDPTLIAAASRDYLDKFETSNDRFGPMEFLSKDTTEQPSHLAIAAWVQDADTHRVLQSAFFPLGEAAQAGGTR